MSCGSKDILKMHPVLCTNTHYDVTDFKNHGMVESTTILITKQLFHEIKKFLTCASDVTFWEVIDL